MQFRRYATLLSTASLAFVGCHPQSPPTATTPATVADALDDISIRVVNRNRIDVMVYVGHDGIRSRLGLATASTSTQFTLPMRILGAGHEYRLIGDPLGVRIVITTETLFARPGDDVIWSLEDSFARSSVVVH